MLGMVASFILPVCSYAQWYPEMPLDGSTWPASPWGPNENSVWSHEIPTMTTQNWMEIIVTNGNHIEGFVDGGFPCMENVGGQTVFDLNNRAEHWTRQFEANDCFLTDYPLFLVTAFDGNEIISFEGPTSTRQQRDNGEIPTTWYLRWEIDYFGNYNNGFCNTLNTPDTLRLHTVFREMRFVNGRWTSNNRFALSGTEPARQGFEEEHSRNFNDYFQIGQRFMHRVRPRSTSIYNEDGSYSHQSWSFGSSLNGLIGDFDLRQLRSINTYIITEVINIHPDGDIDFSIWIGDPLQAGDANRDGQKDVPDIFAFLSEWFAQGDCSDIDCNGTVDVADIFYFLSKWFN